MRTVFFLLFVSSLLFSDEVSYSCPDCFRVPLDEKILTLFNYKKNGVFIEAGANDGITQSNTKRLEEFHGWTGVLVEPSESVYNDLCRNRSISKCFQCVLGSFAEDNTYVWGDFDGNLMSSVGGVRLARQAPQKVLVRSLQSILDEAGITHVNFFSLDTEGYELNVLNGIDFTKTTFDYILIEIYPTEYEKIKSLMLSEGYELVGNFTNYNNVTNDAWDGSHNDYLFKRKA